MRTVDFQPSFWKNVWQIVSFGLSREKYHSGFIWGTITHRYRDEPELGTPKDQNGRMGCG